MKIEEFYNYTILFDLYGKLLSKKQFEVMDKFLNHDISESELAELLGESRQAVHDAITKAKKQLVDFEEKCKFFEISTNTKNQLQSLKAGLLEKDTKKSLKLIDEIIDNL